ncbi:hypothetical protein EBAPG3_15015 [Nitrosospira lacus]|uniref:Uncharacterized protein n=1 Tax=Nitrosospira lacus TaxID=1288494 RepID=A0A1W6SMJ4_9PROT|nr:hypothetical protein EBAPG3_15015 [Nitrosospira lacus]
MSARFLATGKIGISAAAFHGACIVSRRGVRMLVRDRTFPRRILFRPVSRSASLRLSHIPKIAHSTPLNCRV